MVKTMRFSFALILFMSQIAVASNTPLSGTFSNVKKEATNGHKPTLHTKINLVVTINGDGQQLFLQCFDGNKAGFGKVTMLAKPKIVAEIKAGKECPSEKAEVQLDYEEAIVRFKSGWVYLPRGDIHVPIQ